MLDAARRRGARARRAGSCASRSCCSRTTACCRFAADGGRIAVIGPIADSARDLMGDYAHLPHIETLAELRHQANPFGFPSSDVIQPADEVAAWPTILGALRDRFGAIAHRVTPHGTGLREGTDDEIAAAVELARVVGGRDRRASASGPGSRSTPRPASRATAGTSTLLGRQQELLEAVVATGTPTILLVVSGRPLALEWAATHCAAIVLAWVPGESGPAAIADDPRGRRRPRRPAADHDAPPRRPGPAHLSPPPDGRTVELEGRLRRRQRDAGLAVRARTLVHDVHDRGAPRRPPRARHRGRRRRRCGSTSPTRAQRAGDEVVQLYVRDEEASVARPVIELRGFRRVHLDAGRVPDGDVPAVDRGARVHRRRLPARRRARARPPVRRPLVRGPAARRGAAARRPHGRAGRAQPATSPRRATPARADRIDVRRCRLVAV